MTEHQLTPAQEEEVRRRLAEARHTDPMPADVADRLDRVVARLADEPAREATVTRLAHRRRRAASLLAAAAAVVVVGVGIGQVVGSGSDTGESQTSADEAAGDAEAGGPAASEPEAAPADRDGQRLRTTVRIRPGQFTDDVERLRTRMRAAYVDGDSAGQQSLDGPAELRAHRSAVCEPGAWGEGEYEAVRYRGAAGYVVFRPPQGDTQVADLFLCGSELAVRSVTLSAP